jgi:MFS family permease
MAQTHTTTYNPIKAKNKSTAQKGAFDVLRISNFTWFLSGVSLTNAANWIQQVTLNWLVYDFSSSGTMLGTLNLVRSIATVGLAPIAGVAIDRFSQRKLLHATNTWLFAISIGFGFALIGNPGLIWPLFVFSFLGGIGQAFIMPLQQTVVISVTPKKMVSSAIALVQTGWALMRSVGPAIGGFLLLWFGPAGNFFVQAGAYALVAFTIFKLKIPKEEKKVENIKSEINFREGWTYISSNPTTLAFLLLSLVLPIFIVPTFNALTPVYAKDVFAGGPDTLGILLSAIGIGGIAGGFVATSMRNNQFERRGVLQLGALLLLSLMLIAFAFSNILWVGLIWLALAGFFEMIYITTNMTSLQLSVPDALRGRVMGIVSLRSGLMPVGAFVAGVGADLIGPQMVTIILGGCAAVIAVVVFLTSSTVRNYRLGKALKSVRVSIIDQ